jgi:uncharacterized protein YaiI (UPF0178 family)
MQIWVDADACPNSVKEIIFRAANRTKTPVTLVANQALRSPPSAFIKKIIVAAGFDVADNYIVQNLVAGDLVITADVPLADAVVEKGAHALNPRGVFYSEANIKQRLAQRNFSEVLRSTGAPTSGPATLSKRDIQQFSNHLDQFLTKNKL